MRQLSRQNISRKILGRQFYLKQKSSVLKKQVLVRFQPRTFAVPGVFVTSRLSVQDTLRNFNSLRTNVPAGIQMSPVNKVIAKNVQEERAKYTQKRS